MIRTFDELYHTPDKQLIKYESCRLSVGEDNIRTKITKTDWIAIKAFSHSSLYRKGRAVILHAIEIDFGIPFKALLQRLKNYRDPSIESPEVWICNDETFWKPQAIDLDRYTEELNSKGRVWIFPFDRHWIENVETLGEL